MFKFTLLLTAIFITTVANAKAVFLHDSKLPSALQSIVAASLSYNCQLGDKSVWESTTTVRKEKVDQQIYDYYYMTKFEVKHDDGKISTIETESFDIAMYNPTAGVGQGLASIKSSKSLCK